MSHANNIDSEDFRARHAALVKVLDQLQRKAGELKKPYSQTLVFHIRRGLYRVEKSTKQMSLSVVPKLAFELEAYVARIIKDESAQPDHAEILAGLNEGSQLIRQALQALARGEREATEQTIQLFHHLIERMRRNDTTQGAEIVLNPSSVTVAAHDDELDSFEQSLQAMQQDLQAVVANKSPAADD